MPEGAGSTVVTLATMAGDKYGLVGFFLFLLLLGLAGIVIYFLTRNWQRKETADADGQIKALDAYQGAVNDLTAFYQKMLSDANAARLAAEERAAAILNDAKKERESYMAAYNDANRRVAELSGELAMVKKQLESVTQELTALREKFK